MELNEIKLPLSKELSNLRGVYFLFDEDKILLYVGKTVDFRTRLNTHLKSKKRVQPEEIVRGKTSVTSQVPFNSIKYYYFIEINDSLTRDNEEIRYIKLFKPRFNRPFLLNSWKEHNMQTFINYSSVQS